ncbi:MAG: stage III sporulation protein AE [Firmicutes bacterium]|nr:stage III sporulation protein AE [Bacillota bacterium]
MKRFSQIKWGKTGRRLRRARRTFMVISVVFVLCIIVFNSMQSEGVFGEGGIFLTNSTSPGDQLRDNVEETLRDIDLGDLDDIVAGLDGGRGLFGTGSFGDRVRRILGGEFQTDYPNMFIAIMALFMGSVMDVMPIIALIIGIAILSGFMKNLKVESGGDGVRNVVHFVTYAAVVIIVMAAVGMLVATVGSTLASMRRQMDIVFPILLTLMVAVGGGASAGVYQPAVAVLSNGVMQIFSAVVMPIFIITLVFSVVGNLSGNTRLDRFVGFFTSAYKWIIGLVFTVFLAFLTVQGISAGTHDGISIRAARFTIGSYIPYLGGYLSQGFDLVMASSILIKNAIGVAGLYLLFAVVLGPILKIAVFSLGLKLAAAITQPIGDERISNFLGTVNKSFSMLSAVLIGAAFMYFITIGLVLVTGNFI